MYCIHLLCSYSPVCICLSVRMCGYTHRVSGRRCVFAPVGILSVAATVCRWVAPIVSAARTQIIAHWLLYYLLVHAPRSTLCAHQPRSGWSTPLAAHGLCHICAQGSIIDPGASSHFAAREEKCMHAHHTPDTWEAKLMLSARHSIIGYSEFWQGWKKKHRRAVFPGPCYCVPANWRDN